MASITNEFPQLSVQAVCQKMGLSPVSGSYERALCNYLGIFSPTVNSSWIQTLYPALLSIFNSLQAGTYAGMTIDEYQVDANAFTGNVAGATAYAYHPYGDNPYRYSMGLYILDGGIMDFIYQPTHIITWLSTEFLTNVKLAALDDLEAQHNTTNVASDASLAASIANQTTQISSLTSSLAGLTSPTYSNTPARSLNTSYQLSTTKRTKVSYTVAVTTALSLINLGSSGRVFLEISANNSTWTPINSAGVTKAVAVGIAINETQYYNVQGEVPIGYYVRLRSVTTGGATVAFESGQEVVG
jgi:hypothetical protein